MANRTVRFRTPTTFDEAVTATKGINDKAGGVSTAEIADEAVTREKVDIFDSVNLGTPALAAAAALVAEVDPIANGTPSIAAQPDVPRNITITVVDANASITAGTVTVVGTDVQGRAVSEVLDLASALTLVGTKIFAAVTSVTVADLAGEAAGDTLTCGYGDVIGLPNDIDAAAAVTNVVLGGVRIPSPTVATGTSTSGVNAASGTYDGSKELVVAYNVGK